MSFIAGARWIDTVTAIRFSAGNKDLPGGSSLQRFSINPEACQEIVPIEATAVAGRLTTPIFGAGLIASIPDGDIEEEESDKPSLKTLSMEEQPMS